MIARSDEKVNDSPSRVDKAHCTSATRVAGLHLPRHVTLVGGKQRAQGSVHTRAKWTQALAHPETDTLKTTDDNSESRRALAAVS